MDPKLQKLQKRLELMTFKTTMFEAGRFYLIQLPNDDNEDLRFLKVVRSASRQQ